MPSPSEPLLWVSSSEPTALHAQAITQGNSASLPPSVSHALRQGNDGATRILEEGFMDEALMETCSRLAHLGTLRISYIKKRSPAATWTAHVPNISVQKDTALEGVAHGAPSPTLLHAVANYIRTLAQLDVPLKKSLVGTGKTETIHGTQTVAHQTLSRLSQVMPKDLGNHNQNHAADAYGVIENQLARVLSRLGWVVIEYMQGAFYCALPQAYTSMASTYFRSEPCQTPREALKNTIDTLKSLPYVQVRKPGFSDPLRDGYMKFYQGQFRAIVPTFHS